MRKETIKKVHYLCEHPFDDWKKTYQYIQEITDEILRDYYESEDNMSKGDKRKILYIPIDIRGIIETYHIDVAEMDLNVDTGFRVDRINGYLRQIGMDEEGKKKWRIYIEYKDSEFTKRYVLAHEFSHYILRTFGEPEIEKDSTMEFCIDPMIPKKSSEVIADVMTAFFLLPYQSLLPAMKEYTEEMREKMQYPIESVIFLSAIADQAQISSYHMFQCFQHIRIYLCMLHEEYKKEPLKKNELTPYEKLFR